MLSVRASRFFAFAAVMASTLFAAISVAKPDPVSPIRNVKAPPHLQVQEKQEECCGNESHFLLGRASPLSSVDFGDFRYITGTDGKTRVFARLAHVVDTSKRTASLPDSADWSMKAPNVLKQMYLNNKYGCCVISSRYHAIGFMIASDGGKETIGTDSEIYSTYQTACGRGDNGCNMSAVNQFMQKTGIKVAGVTHKIDAAVAVDWTNKELVKAAIYIFGNLNIGMKLPNDWYSSPDGADWGVTNSRIVGGHEVQAFGYDDKGVWISTWGGKRRILWDAFTSRKWIDELYTMLSPDWTGSDKLAPNGIDVTALQTALAAIAAGKVPDPPAPPQPPVPPLPPVPPQPPTPPVVDGPFTGIMIYKDGVVTKIIPGAGDTHSDLVKAGFDAKTILDVLKLLSDLRQRKGFDVYQQDIADILADLIAAERKKKESKAEFGEQWFKRVSIPLTPYSYIVPCSKEDAHQCLNF